TRFTAFMDSLDTFGSVQGGLLLGAVQVTGAPYLSAGKYYAAAAAGIPTLTVLPNCLASTPIPGGAPGDSAYVYIPFHYGAPRVAAAAAGAPQLGGRPVRHGAEPRRCSSQHGDALAPRPSVAGLDQRALPRRDPCDHTRPLKANRAGSGG